VVVAAARNEENMTRLLLGVAAIVLSVFSVSSVALPSVVSVSSVAPFSVVSVAAQPIAQATCKSCPATYIGDEEIQQYLKRAVAMKTVDQQVRSVDVGKSNVAIGLVHRTKIEKPGEVAEHDHVSEVYHIISGSATLVTGPDLVGAERRPATNTNVRLLNGPGHNAKAITNGVAHQLKAGDVMVIPAGTGHWFTKIDDHITYLMVRVDPDKVTPLKDEAASKADLAGKKP
jgi:mannose-6-phosphate isomerase-like protein (cupin superfamily)